MAGRGPGDSARACSQDNTCRGERNCSCFSSSDFYSSLGLKGFDFLGDTSGTEEDTESTILYGTLRGSIVGLRYYTGIVSNNEMVALQREPNNPYDKNAVQVNNVNGDQVGHIKKELAPALAEIMDNKLAVVEGVVPYGAKNSFTMPVEMSFWGREENKEAVLDQLKRHGFKLAPPPKGSEDGFESKWISGRAGPSYSAPVHAAVQLTTEQLKGEFDKLFEDLKEDDKTCEMEAAEAVGTRLLPHQKQALCWMVSRENSNDLPPFWEERSNFYYNTLTNYAEKKRPKNVLGGILADDMGLGKTLTTIALILTNFQDGKPLPVEKIASDKFYEESGTNSMSSVGRRLCKDSSNVMEPGVSNVKKFGTTPLKYSSCLPKRDKAKKPRYLGSSDLEESEEQQLQRTETTSCVNQEDSGFASVLLPSSACLKRQRRRKGTASVQSVEKKYSDDGPRATLIVCPLSVLSNWIDQFEQHIHQDFNVKIYVYYGSERSKDPSVLSEQDVVLTTYSILATDYGIRGNSPLHKVKWLRIVLDEGHAIRNPNAQQTKAALNLEGHRRWVLTGTPIQNYVKDLWSLISFLKLKPFADREWWHRTIQHPVTMGAPGGLWRLQSLIKSITLRRSKTSQVKGAPILDLPERKVLIQYVTLTEEERQIYQSVKNEGKATISRFFNEGNVLAHYADILGVLLRLRQICCHPHLCINTSSSFSNDSRTPEELHVRLVSKMKLVLSSGSDEECAVCLESLTLPVITHCAHVFCKPCIFEVLRNEQPNAKCPLCRNELQVEHLVECPLEEEIDSSSGKKPDQEWISSSKINALMHALIELRRDNPAAKCLVVSQFTTFLSLIENPLKESGFAFTRLDGSMAQKKRVEAVRCFQSNQAGSATIMLLSLKAGGVGLNLTAASRVFLMDPWKNYVFFTSIHTSLRNADLHAA
ncbi:helicase-like transcription factor isoform X3 [Myiozetetes cayanensis]|uniref:helicase-like transcription factor isoform X3 n=1 Tax=Myiozetetes cayanensis TaxID=478635 RepID=UPI00215DDEDD|nr:helicase-like transcription factor isoform X3 [Myiozetetes cayanensis]XP_050164733.1 helicase-like transcription factor isoform X3 [Myiozetetes cayanensis]XP_050164734.1 helicase-like transcription factor isoform X3 [Myiozetetes cayanensis]